ncbi:hypothetical protein AXX17_ATUG03850 (mitochondrion) [Arabidopsis thaliana]|uniref:Uncharacterized protein n=1 Tax=Arabidopsis thaliana TaxID=3702 RepID=A0A178U6A2_ARATH|nr:hypothetical protein AXX17_ATUG03850 [Arabidopsis thaliana]
MPNESSDSSSSAFTVISTQKRASIPNPSAQCTHLEQHLVPFSPHFEGVLHTPSCLLLSTLLLEIPYTTK